MKLKKINEEHYVVENNDGVITHSTQPIEIIHTSGVTMTNPPMGFINIIELPLSEVKELLGVVDVERMAFGQYGGGENNVTIDAFIDGYTQAIEDNKGKKYTIEDMLTIRNQLVTMLPVGDVAAWDMIQAVSKYTKWFDEYIQSLQPKTEWEVEFINGKLTLI